MSKVVSGRVPDELADEVAAYAQRRGVKRGVVVEAALREFLDLARRGVPDLPEPRRSGRPAGAASQTSPARVVTTEADHAAELERLRAVAAGHAARQRAERDRKHRERGW